MASLTAVVDAVSSQEFQAGLRWGGGLGLIGVLFALIWRRWRQGLLPIGGPIVAVAAAVAMSVTRSLSTTVGAGLCLLAVAGALFSLSRRIALLPALTALPGAWLIGRSGPSGTGWVEPIAVTTVALVGPVVAGFEEDTEKSPIPMWLFTVSVAGAWLTLPDTEEVLVLLGALSMPALLTWPLRMLRLGSVGAYTLPGLYIWVVMWGGRGRESSIFGALAALGLLAAAPIAAWMAGRGRVSSYGLIGFFLVFGHAGLVIFVTRVAGFQVGPRSALLFAFSAVVTALMLWFAVERSVGKAPDRH